MSTYVAARTSTLTTRAQETAADSCGNGSVSYTRAHSSVYGTNPHPYNKHAKN